MKLYLKFTGATARREAATEPPFGPGFSSEVLGRIEALEVHGTGVRESELDRCEFRALDEAGELIASRILTGY